MDLDVLALVLQAEDAARTRGLGLADEDVHDLGRAARAHEAGAAFGEVQDFQAGLLERLAARHLVRALAVLDDTGDRLEQPGIAIRLERAGAELLDQHDLVAHRVVGQHGGGMAAREHLAHQLRTEAAREPPVPQPVAHHPKIAVEHHRTIEDLDPWIRHGGPRSGEDQVNAL